MSNITSNFDSGEWLSSDKTEGVGQSNVLFTAPAWEGREDRITFRVVRSGRYLKGVTLRQLGVLINEAEPEKLYFPREGGDLQVMLVTNAAQVEAAITSEEKDVYGKIKVFTTASGIQMTVNQKELEYGFPGDPGLEGKFEVSVIISMPDNTYGFERFENLTINGILIPIYQEGAVKPYIELDKDFDEIQPTDTTNQLQISSNLNNYRIEIVECDNGIDEPEEEASLDVSTKEIDLNPSGDAKLLGINVYPEQTQWHITDGE